MSPHCADEDLAVLRWHYSTVTSSQGYGQGSLLDLLGQLRVAGPETCHYLDGFGIAQEHRDLRHT